MVSALQRARFRLALFCWARLLPVLSYRRDLKSLIAFTAPSARTPFAGLPAEYIVKRVKRTTRRPWFMGDRRCLREGILAYRFLKLSGLEPEMHFGVDRTSIVNDRLKAHCWLVLDGSVILNPPEPTMIEVFVLCPEGSARDEPKDGQITKPTEAKSV